MNNEQQTLETSTINEFADFEPGSLVFPGKESESTGTDIEEEAKKPDDVELGDQPEVEEIKSEESEKTEGTESKSEEAELAKVEDAGESPETDKGDGKAPEEQPDYGSWLKEKTNGLVADENALTSILEERDRLLEDSKKTKEPDFPNERAKKAYEFILENKFDFADSLQQYRHIMGIDVEKMSDRDKQKSAFILKNSDLGEDAGEFFDIQYEKKYADLEDEDIDERDKRFLELQKKKETIEAEKYIQETQGKLKADAAKEFEEKEPENEGPTEEDLNKWRGQVTEALSDFEKMEVSVEDQNVAIAINKEDIEMVNNALNNPSGFWEESISKPGKDFSITDYRNNVAKMVLFDKLVKQSYDNGFSNGKIHSVDETKNLDKTKTTTSAPKPEKEESFQDAWMKAVKG